MAADADARQSVRRYRLVDLGVIAPSFQQLDELDLPESSTNAPSGDHVNTLGINEHGQVVGGRVSSVSPLAVHAFVWLPVPAYGLPAGTIDLGGHPALPPDGDWSVANDINDTGHVVGAKGQDVSSTTHAFLWALGTGAGGQPTVATLDLHTTDGPFSVADAVNGAASPRVAGQTTVLCEDTSVVLARGFHRTIGVSDPMTVLDPLSDSVASSAHDVRTGAPLSIAGRDYLAYSSFPPDPCTDPGFGTTVCPFGAWDGLAWEPSGGVLVATPLLGLSAAPAPDWGSAGRGVNESREIVGYGWFDPPGGENADPPAPCVTRALVWWAASTTPHDLGALVQPDPLLPPTPTLAWSCTNRDETGCVTVVGSATVIESGVAWYGHDDQWCWADLNDLVFACTDGVDPGSPQRQVVAAHAVNDSRHIAVVFTVFNAGVPGLFEYHAGVLTEAADLNGDLRVDNADLALMQAAQCGGSSPPCVGWPDADLNCDGAVDVTDRTLLLARWTGPSRLAVVRPLCACGAEQGPGESLGDGEVALAEAALDAIGLPSAAFDAWSETATAEEVDAVGQFVSMWVADEIGAAEGVAP